MPRQLYEICGADERQVFSPYCWRVRMALRHKGLDFESVPWHFRDKEKLAFSGQPLADAKVPVLVDTDGSVVYDSLAILRHLERTYPERPLIGDALADARLDFICQWVDRQLNMPVFRMIVLDIFNALDAADQQAFRESRERRLGMTLEQFQDTAAGLAQLDQVLAPLRALLQHAPFVDGQAPAAGDYVVFGVFAWARVVSARPLLAADDPLQAWLERMLGLSDGFARQVPAATEY